MSVGYLSWFFVCFILRWICFFYRIFPLGVWTMPCVFTNFFQVFLAILAVLFWKLNAFSPDVVFCHCYFGLKIKKEGSKCTAPENLLNPKTIYVFWQGQLPILAVSFSLPVECSSGTPEIAGSKAVALPVPLSWFLPMLAVGYSVSFCSLV